MIYAVLTGLLILLIYLPQLWVWYVLKKYSKALPDLPGNGAELAQHLIQRFDLQGIVLEQTTKRNDHFDPQAKAVRLSPENYQGKSLTAIAIAAHEVGHAIQFHKKEDIFKLRQKYIPIANRLTKIGVLILMAFPVIAVIVKVPALIFATLALSIVLQLLGALAYLIVLPEEWDASFHKALPILIEGRYIETQQVAAVNKILKAAALTYFAGALASIVNIGRWLLLLRR